MSASPDYFSTIHRRSTISTISHSSSTDAARKSVVVASTAANTTLDKPLVLSDPDPFLQKPNRFPTPLHTATSSSTSPPMPTGAPSAKVRPAMAFKITSDMMWAGQGMLSPESGLISPGLGPHSRGTSIRVGRLPSTADLFHSQNHRDTGTSDKLTPTTLEMLPSSIVSTPSSPTLSTSSISTIMQDETEVDWLTDEDVRSPTWPAFVTDYAAGLWDPCKVPTQPYSSSESIVFTDGALGSSTSPGLSNGLDLLEASSAPWDTLEKLVPRVHPDPKSWFEKHGYLLPPPPPDEPARIKALSRYSVIYRAKDVNFDRITHLAKLVFQCQVAVITLIDENVWEKSDPGAVPLYAERALSFCGHTILQRGDEPQVVLDATKDWRYAGNPWVVGRGYLRFYAGAPLRTEDGHNIGTLCLVDDKPRSEFSPKSREVLKDFAAIAMREIELWRDKIQLRIRNRIQKVMEQFTRECFEMDLQLEDGDQGEERMQRVYRDAASLVKTTLDVDGALVLDISHFEALDAESEKPHYHGNLFDDPSSSTACELFGPIPLLPALGQDEDSPRADKPSGYTGYHHSQLAEFLSNHNDGEIYERKDLPSCFASILPANARCVMIAPVFNVDKRPFLLLCAYITRGTARMLESYELQFLRSVGVVLLSAMLKRRTMLADTAKSLFISNMSHELRTPLHGILASAELLQDTALVAEQNGYLKTVEGCAQSLVETVNHVLDFTKLAGSTRGRQKQFVKHESIDLKRLIDDTVESCWMQAQARAPAASGLVNPPQSLTGAERYPFVEIVIDIALREPGWWIKSDKSGIRRILTNLIGNSLKFTEDGFVHVRLRDLAPEPGSNKLNIEISVFDSGKGISRDFLKNRVFQPFSQENPLEAGTGLGLAVVNSIAASLGGKVDVWSAEGVGTEIRITMQVEVLHEGRPGQPLVPPGQSIAVGLVGFQHNQHHEGLRLFRETIAGYIVDWFGFTIIDDACAADILVVNEDENISRTGTKEKPARPVIFLSTIHSASGAVDGFQSGGGWCRVVRKPFGPVRLEEALRAAVVQLELPQPGAPQPFDSQRHRPKDVVSDTNGKDDASNSPSTIAITEDGSVLLESAIGTIESDHNLVVLLVDDNKVNRNLMGHWLSKRGFDFQQACDGQDAVDVFTSQPLGFFDVVLIDLTMPRMNGFEATAEIRRLEKNRQDSTKTTKQSKIFALTGLGSAEDKAKAFGAGVDGFLIKPVSLKTLDTIFRRLVKA